MYFYAQAQKQVVVQAPAPWTGSQPYSSLPLPRAHLSTQTEEFLRGKEQGRSSQRELSIFIYLFYNTALLELLFDTCSSSPSYRNSSSRERGDFDRSNRSSDRFDRRDERRDDRDRNRLQVTKRSFSRENQERSREREQRGSADPVRRVASMTDDRDRGQRARSRENGRWHYIQGLSVRTHY